MRYISSRIVIYGYVLLSCFHLIFIITHCVWETHLTKLFLIPLLLYYVITYDNYKSSWNWLGLGLLFSFFGDWALIYTQDASFYFMLGLVSFLITHLFYIFGFNTLLKYKRENDERTASQWMSGIIVICTLGFLYYIVPQIEGLMRTAVTVYALVICLMVIYAYKLFQRMVTKASFMLFMGALFFMLSDMVLALTVFKWEQSSVGTSVVIMSTYLLGQFLIVVNSLWIGEKMLNTPIKRHGV